MTIRLDWPSMRDRSGVSVDELHVLFLTEGQRLMFLGVLENLRWRASWSYPSDSDWQEISDQVDNAGNRLVDMATVQDLIDAINSISTGSPSTLNVDCCTGDQTQVAPISTFPFPTGAGDVPNEVVAAGYATDNNDVSGYENYLCFHADIIVDNMINKVNQLQGLVAAGTAAIGTIAAVFAAFSSGGVTAVLAVLFADVAATYSVLEGIADTAVFDAIEADVESMRSDLKCIITSGMSSTQLMQAIRAMTAQFGGLSGLLIPHLGWEPVIEGVMAGRDKDGRTIVSDTDAGGVCSPTCSGLGVGVDGEGTPIANADGVTYVKSSEVSVGQIIRWESLEIQNTIGDPTQRIVLNRDIILSGVDPSLSVFFTAVSGYTLTGSVGAYYNWRVIDAGLSVDEISDRNPVAHILAGQWVGETIEITGRGATPFYVDVVIVGTVS